MLTDFHSVPPNSIEFNKSVSNTVSKDRSFRRYIGLGILTNPDGVTLTKKGNILGKNPLPISLFTYYNELNLSLS